jgi:beta-galactosidase
MAWRSKKPMRTTKETVTLIASVLLVALVANAGASAESPRRRQPLMTDWRFLRGAATGAEKPAFDDGKWRQVDLPHDWSIEDLPPRDADPLFHMVTLVPGSWRFQWGDEAGWKERDFDDSAWRQVRAPETWAGYGGTVGDDRTGWYRRRFQIPETAAGKNVLIALGRIRNFDDTYVDGQRVNQALSWEDVYWSNVRVKDRVYLLRHGLGAPGEHVIAVRVRGKADGGLVGAVPEAPRVSPCDPGRSAGGISTGYAVGGTGWYRNRFTLAAGDQGKAVRIVFDGSYYETTVWLNGTEVGRNVYGYTPFSLDLTPHLRPAGQENLLAVRVVNPGENSRWYSGSGIYRPVYLEITSPTRIAVWGVAITNPEVTAGGALVQFQVETEGRRDRMDQRVRVRVVDPDDKPVAVAEAAVEGVGQTGATVVRVRVNTPRLWSPASPNLYRADVEVLSGGKAVDGESVPFGIRTLAWSADRGLLLNGQPIELKGGCIHHDHGPLGASSYPAAEERRVMKLKAAGYNAIRCAHNPPATSFLDACDRLGMLVMDEAFDMWNQANNPEDYHRFFKEWWQRDIDAMVRRDRNHPSVIMWSIGNEIRERFEPLGVETAKRLAARVREIDPTRPVTSAFNSVSDKADPYFGTLDICGYNYNPDKYEYDHGRLPNRIMLGTESFARESFMYWNKVVLLPYVIGDFIWTAWDYRGESGIGHTVQRPAENNAYLMPWPWHNAFCGDFDVCGFEKPQSLYRQVLWGVRPLALLVERPGPDGGVSEADRWGWRDEQPSWTWPGAEGQEMVVRVYSAGDQVSLTLDGKEIGTKPVEKALTTEFRVPYQPGGLTVRAFKAGKELGMTSLVTAGRLAGLRLTAEHSTISAARDSLAFIALEAVDADGNLVQVDTSEVVAQLVGPGELIALGNGDPTDCESVQDARQKLWRGRALAIIRSTGKPGKITMQVTTSGLPPAVIAIHAVRERESVAN